MFGISLPEFLIIACIAIVLIKPKDIPTIAKYSKIIFKKINYFKKEASKLYGQIHEALIDKDEIKEEQNKGEQNKEDATIADAPPLHIALAKVMPASKASSQFPRNVQ